MLMGDWKTLAEVQEDFFRSPGQYDYWGGDYDAPEGLAAKQAAIDAAFAGAEVLFAIYTYANYDGDAFVLFARDGQLFEVNGSHCSCYGLEGQWEPEETTVEAIRHRMTEGTLGSGNDWPAFKDELEAVLKAWETRD